MPTEIIPHPAQPTSARSPVEVVDLLPSDVQRCEGGGFVFSPRSEKALITTRTVQQAEAADKILNDPPMSVTRVTWMGPGKITATYVNARDPALAVAEYQEARKRRARQTREMHAFLDDIESTLEAAGVPPAATPTSGASMSQSRSPMLSPKGPGSNSGRATPASGTATPPMNARNLHLNQLAQPKAATGTRDRMGQSTTSNPVSTHSANAASPMMQPPKALRRASKRDEAEALSLAASQERLALGELLLSAYDGSAHERDDLLAYNEWAYARMAYIIEEEEDLERTGAELSPAMSEHHYCPSESQQSNPPLVTVVSIPGQSPVARPKTRRPARLPGLDVWNRLPPLVNAEGSPLDPDVIRAENKAYNEDARKCAKVLMAHKCFRRIDFAELYALDKQNGVVEVIVNKRKEVETPTPDHPTAADSPTDATPTDRAVPQSA